MGKLTVGQQNSDAIEIYYADHSSGQPVMLAETEPILLPGSEGVAPQGLELRHLRYFVAVADAGTFTYAAERMFIAQPTLSQQIRRLEEMVGTPLLQRRREGVRLTAAGAVLLQESRTILSLLDHGVMPPGLPEALAVETASRLRALAAAAGVDVAWLETPLDAEFSLIRHRRADAGLGWLAPAEEALAAPLDVMNLGEFEPDVWIPASHPAARRETISLGELARMDVIHGPPRSRAATYGAWLAVLRTIDPRFEFTDPPVRNSLPITLAFAATGSRPTAVLTCPCHPIGARKTPPPFRAADTCNMVPVGLDQSPLAATAGLVWNSDLPRPLQQVLFDTADGVIEPFSSWSLGTGIEAWSAAHHAGPLPQRDQLRSAIASPAMMARVTGERSDPSGANPVRT